MRGALVGVLGALDQQRRQLVADTGVVRRSAVRALQRGHGAVEVVQVVAVQRGQLEQKRAAPFGIALGRGFAIVKLGNRAQITFFGQIELPRFVQRAQQRRIELDRLAVVMQRFRGRPKRLLHSSPSR